jgi:hypothetical protein
VQATISNVGKIWVMIGRSAKKHSIHLTQVTATSERPGSKGTYIVRLSPANRRKLKVKNGAYLDVSYGDASVPACLSVDDELDDNTIRTDQTIRTAIHLDKILQGSGKATLVHDPTGSGDLTHPIVVQPSSFRGPSLLNRLLKQQYLMCVVHHALPEDMEKPIARLTTDSMAVIGVESGSKILLVGSNGKTRPMRCLAIGDGQRLPVQSMHTVFTVPEYQRRRRGKKRISYGIVRRREGEEPLGLPWITLDKQTRLLLEVAPWQPMLIGRYPLQVLAAELGQVVSAVALSALGGAIVVPDWLKQDYPLLPWTIVAVGFVTVVGLIWWKIRSRL